MRFLIAQIEPSVPRWRMISYRIMPVATDTLKLSTPVPTPAMGRLRTPSHRDFTSGETPLPLSLIHIFNS